MEIDGQEIVTHIVKCSRGIQERGFAAGVCVELDAEGLGGSGGDEPGFEIIVGGAAEAEGLIFHSKIGGRGGIGGPGDLYADEKHFYFLRKRKGFGGLGAIGGGDEMRHRSGLFVSNRIDGNGGE